MLAASAAVIVLFGAGGLYAWVSGKAGDVLSSSEPRVILADKEPVKVAPEDPGGKAVPNQDKAVYDRVQGAAVQDPKQESLISANEEPVDVVQQTLIPEMLTPEADEGDLASEATPVGETEDPRLLPGTEPAPQQPGDNATTDVTTITPRKVRTMIVRPDGTLVTQEVPATGAANPAPSAPSATAASAAPALSTLESSDGAPPPAITAAKPVMPAAASTTDTAAAPTSPAISNPAEAPASTPPAAAEAVSAGTPAPNAPVPTMRPAQQPVNVVGTVSNQGNVIAAAKPAAQEVITPAGVGPMPELGPPVPPPKSIKATQPKATAPAAAAAPADVAAVAQAPVQPAAAAPATTSPGGYVIQIASLPSEAEAQKSYKSLSAKFSGVIGGRGVDIKRAEIAGKGTYYRVRVPAGSREEANALCERFRSAGGTCLVTR